MLGHDPNADIALLRVDPAGLSLRPLPLGDSEKVQVGEPVAAIGSPFGQEQSLSVGIVSAVDRSVGSLTEFDIAGAIQTDAAINPGNSGGPLVGADGRVIGVNQQIQSRSGGGEGVGFAVPIDVVKRSVDQLRETGRARYAYLGVSSIAAVSAARRALRARRGQGRLDPGRQPRRARRRRPGLRGGTGEEVFQGSTFARGGDVITKLGGRPVTGAEDLAAAIARFKPGETIDVEVNARRAGAAGEGQARRTAAGRPLRRIASVSCSKPLRWLTRAWRITPTFAGGR